MKDVDTADLLQALQEVEKRAERVSDEHVIATYVDTGALAAALGSRDNGVIFGRRGTGKTHALKFLAETERKKGNFVVYIDMEQDTGSTEGRYSDTSLSLAERATRLVVDVLSIIHDRLLEDAFSGRLNTQIEVLERALDHFGEVVVVSEVQSESSTSAESQSSSHGALKISVSDVAVGLDSSEGNKTSAARATKTTGTVRHRIHFGAVGDVLRQVMSNHEAKRCWIILDEWSGVPLDLQPYLGQMLRRLFFGIPKVSVRSESDRFLTAPSGEWLACGETT